MHDCIPDIFMWFLEIELRTSCLRGKQFRARAISLVFCFECSTYAQASLRNKVFYQEHSSQCYAQQCKIKINCFKLCCRMIQPFKVPEWGQDLSVFLYCSSSYCQRQSLSLNQKLPTQSFQLPVSTLHSWVTSTQELHPTFYVGARDLNSGTYADRNKCAHPLRHLPSL